MANVTKRFEGPTKVKVTVLGIRTNIVFKLKGDKSFLDIRNGAIVGYRGVTPNPYTLKQVIGIREAEYAYADSIKGSREDVAVAAEKAKARLSK